MFYTALGDGTYLASALLLEEPDVNDPEVHILALVEPNDTPTTEKFWAWTNSLLARAKESYAETEPES